MDLGFFNLGRFSVRYRNAFGEFPSATLQRWPEAGELTSDGPERRTAGAARWVAEPAWRCYAAAPAAPITGRKHQQSRRVDARSETP
jgi:hypothetical protein